MNEVVVVEESVDVLPGYGQIPISFEVRSILDVRIVKEGLGGFRLEERAVEEPWVKDYDACDGGPIRWPQRFDVSNWGFFLAFVGTERVGGCTVAYRTDKLFVLEERKDLAVLWDIRVTPERRGQGIGKRLFDAAVSWARSRSCPRLKVETQNINVPACRFYLRQGCTLGIIHRFAYADFPDEVELVWCKGL